MPRSVRVHPDHHSTIAVALERNGFLTQGDLAAHLQIALSTVSNFCRGLNVSISKYEQICEALNLDKKTLFLPQQNEKPDPVPFPEKAQPQVFFALDQAWVGREQLTADLMQKLKNSCRLLLLTGMSGIGKTALAERITMELNTLPLIRINLDDREQPGDFAHIASHLLEQTGQSLRAEERRDPQTLMQRLVRHLQLNPYLIIIDSLEQILKGNETEGWSEFQDPLFVSCFQRLLSSSSFPSRLILTSQELPMQIPELGSRYPNFWFCQPLSGLSDMEQMDLFAKTGLNIQASSDSRSYLERIGTAYEGHPLALRIIAGEIGSHPFFGNVAAYWGRYGQEIEEVERAIDEAREGKTTSVDDQWKLDRFTRTLRLQVRSRLEATFNRLNQQVKLAYILLCEASVYRCPVSEDWWITHLEDWTENTEDQQAALDALRERYLIEEVIEAAQYKLRQHNLVRSVALDHIRQFDLNET